MPIAHERSAATGSHRLERLAECGGHKYVLFVRFMVPHYAHMQYVCKLDKMVPAVHPFSYGVGDDWSTIVPLAVRLTPEPLLDDDVTPMPCAGTSASIPDLL